MSSEKNIPSEVKHIVWDWNGTLLCDMQLSYGIMNDCIVGEGFPALTFEQYQDYLLHPLRGMYERIGFTFEKTPYETFSANFHDRYNEKRLECSLQEGALDLLRAISKQGITQSVLSAHPEVLLREMVVHHELSLFFNAIVGLPDTNAGSKVQRGREWLQEQKLDPETIVLIGDTDHDWETASDIGISCILVAHGYNRRKRLEGCGVPVVDSFFEIPTLLFGVDFSTFCETNK